MATKAKMEEVKAEEDQDKIDEVDQAKIIKIEAKKIIITLKTKTG